MNSNSKLGKAITHSIYEQYLMYKELKQRIKYDIQLNNDPHRVHRLKSKQAKSQCLSRQSSSQAIRSSQYMSCNKQHEGIKRTSSTQRKLRIFKTQKSMQLNDPFSKIHIKRPNSAMESRPISNIKQKQKESNRYEQIKQYYQSKYETKSTSNHYKQQFQNREIQQTKLSDDTMVIDLNKNLSRNQNNNNNARRNIHYRNCKH